MNGTAKRGATRRREAAKRSCVLLGRYSPRTVRASVAEIAAWAGVGVGSLYRRYPPKGALFQHLCHLSLAEYRVAAEQGLSNSDPWEGFAQYVIAPIAGTGSLAPIAGTGDITDEMAAASAPGDAVAAEIIERARAAAVLRPDVNAVDVALLIEQLGRSPLVEQVRKQGRADLLHAAEHGRERLIRIALDGLRAKRADVLPGSTPGWELFHERLREPTHADRPSYD